MSCISELDYEEEQSSELETLRCIYTDEELTGIHCVARLHTAAVEQLYCCHVCISSQKYRRTLPASKLIYPARMQMAPQVSPVCIQPHSQSMLGLIPVCIQPHSESILGLIPVCIQSHSESYIIKHIYMGQTLL